MVIVRWMGASVSLRQNNLHVSKHTPVTAGNTMVRSIERCLK